MLNAQRATWKEVQLTVATQPRNFSLKFNYKQFLGANKVYNILEAFTKKILG